MECLSPDEVLLYPANELVAAEAAISSPETLAQRMDVLIRLSQGFSRDCCRAFFRRSALPASKRGYGMRRASICR